MIILTKEQKDWFLGIAEESPDTQCKFLELNPVKIKNNLWILPESILEDERFPTISLLLKEKISEFTIREVSSNELIEAEFTIIEQ